MAKMTGSEFAEKWARNIAGSTEYIRRGIESVTESPGQKAARKRDKWVARMTSKEVHDRWAKGVASVPLEEWKRRAIEIGLSRIPSGASAATSKMARFGEALLAYQEQGLAKINAMPDVTLEDSRARLLEWFNHMSKFRKPTG